MKCCKCKLDIAKSRRTYEVKLGICGINTIDSWLEGVLCLECAKKLASDYGIIDSNPGLWEYRKVKDTN